MPAARIPSDHPQFTPAQPKLPGNRLVIWLGVGLSAILLALMGSLFFRLGAEILLDSTEREGVRRLLPLYQLISSLQEHRGISGALQPGNDSLSERRTVLEAKISRQFEVLGASADNGLRDNPNWLGASGDWQEIIADGADWTDIENFNRHTQTIRSLLRLLSDVADNHKLSIDRELDTYHLMDMLVNKLPLFVEQLGEIRGQGAYALSRQYLPEQIRFELLKGIDAIANALDRQRTINDKIIATSPELAAPLRSAQASLEAHAKMVFGILRDDVLAERFATPADEFIREVSEEIDASYAVIYVVYAPALEEKLDRRIRHAWGQLGLVGLATLAALLVVALLVRQLVMRNRELAFSMHSLEAENQHRRSVEEALRVAAGVAETANRAKTQFLANLSHEIRTPLNGVLGMAELLAISNPSSEQQELIAGLQSAGASLRTMLDRILDFTHIEAGHITMDMEPLHLSEIIDAVLRSVRHEAEAKGLSLRHSQASDLPPLLMGDSRRLQQVIRELLDNAVKFTAAGEVSITAAVTPAEEDEHVILHVDIADTGIGVPESMRAAIFESFVQADGSVTRQVGGNGLGLAIARSLVVMMGGEITYQPRPEGGSVFHLAVPLQRFDETAA